MIQWGLGGERLRVLGLGTITNTNKLLRIVNMKHRAKQEARKLVEETKRSLLLEKALRNLEALDSDLGNILKDAADYLDKRTRSTKVRTGEVESMNRALEKVLRYSSNNKE